MCTVNSNTVQCTLECPILKRKTPNVMTWLLPPIFLFLFGPWFKKKNSEKCFTFFFPCRVTFWPPQIALWWKIWKIVWKQFLIAQKKRLDALNATQKTTAPNNVRFLKKSRKTFKKYHFWLKRQKMVIFEVFFVFFRNRTLLRAGVFCVAFSASRRFFWAIKNCFRTFKKISL